MILHVAELDKFIPPFIKLVKKNFDLSMHRFWLRGDESRYPYDNNNNIYQVKRGFLGRLLGFIYLIVQLHRAEKIILHGLFNIHVVVLLAAMPWVHKKCYWVLWGGDYFTYRSSSKNLKYKIKEFFRRFLIRRIGHLVTYIPGSVELVRDWYGAKGRFHECLAYTSNVYNGGVPEGYERDGKVRVLVGNSANSTNRHLDVFKKIIPYFNNNVFIYSPLSYGDESYARQVVSEGRSLFGNNFIPLMDLLSTDQYTHFMSTIDVVLFNHNRQQAMGNTINFLGMGKKLYMSSSIKSWDFLVSKGIDVYDIEGFEGFEGFDDFAPILKNHQRVCEYFSESNLIKQWRGIFNA